MGRNTDVDSGSEAHESAADVKGIRSGTACKACGTKAREPPNGFHNLLGCVSLCKDCWDGQRRLDYQTGGPKSSRTKSNHEKAKKGCAEWKADLQIACEKDGNGKPSVEARERLKRKYAEDWWELTSRKPNREGRVVALSIPPSQESSCIPSGLMYVERS